MPTTGWYRGIGLVLGLVLLSGPSLAQTPSSETLREWFQRNDRNGDGKLDRGEFQEAVVEGFYFRDKNKDGYLSIEELQGSSPAVVKAASRTRANRLTLDEYVNALFKDFAAADKDGDGTLTLEETDVYIHPNQR
jgi:Ca2+-binding EF-hand superfamily protein